MGVKNKKSCPGEYIAKERGKIREVEGERRIA